MEEINKTIVKSLVSQAMLEFAIAKLNNINVETDSIADEYARQIIEELK